MRVFLEYKKSRQITGTLESWIYPYIISLGHLPERLMQKCFLIATWLPLPTQGSYKWGASWCFSFTGFTVNLLLVAPRWSITHLSLCIHRNKLTYHAITLILWGSRLMGKKTQKTRTWAWVQVLPSLHVT